MKDNVQRCAACGQPRNTAAHAEETSLLLTGRMMHVSRLATVGELTSGVAHELNQPLAAIANYAQASVRVLNSPSPDMADIREALEEIATQAVRAGDIIRRMRNLVRQDNAERTCTQPDTLIREMIDLLQADARTHDARLRLDVQQGLPGILVDSAQIQHVLLNLVRNAMEALATIPAGQREIVVGATLAADGNVELYVSDNGPGVPESIADRLGEPFFTTKDSGTGLGLAISNTIARTHSGTFGHRPNKPTGACFYIRIPAVTGAAS